MTTASFRPDRPTSSTDLGAFRVAVSSIEVLPVLLGTRFVDNGGVAGKNATPLTRKNGR